MNYTLTDIVDNTRAAREFSLLGNYESSIVYYQGVLQQISRLVQSISDPARAQQWQEIQRLIVSEYENVRDLQNILLDFKCDNRTNRPGTNRSNEFVNTNGLSLSMVSINSAGQFEHGKRWISRDPEVWSPPATDR